MASTINKFSALNFPLVYIKGHNIPSIKSAILNVPHNILTPSQITMGFSGWVRT